MDYIFGILVLILGCSKENLPTQSLASLNQNANFNDPEPKPESITKASQLTLDFIRAAIKMKSVWIPGQTMPVDLQDFFLNKAAVFHSELQKFAGQEFMLGVIQAIDRLNTEENNYLKTQLLKNEFPKSSELRTYTSTRSLLFLTPFIFTPKEAFAILEEFKIPSGSVRYNGITGMVEFLDTEVEEKTRQLAFILTLYKRTEKPFLELFLGLSKEQQTFLSVDTNTDDPRSRIEPIDLIASLQKNRILRDLQYDTLEESKNPYQINTLELKSFLSVALRKRMGAVISDSDLKNYGLVIFKNKNPLESRQLLFCYEPQFEVNLEGVKSKSYGDDFYSTYFFDINNYPRSKHVSFECGKLNYNVKVEKSSSNTTPTDIPEVQLSENLRAVSTIGLVNEMGHQLRTFAFLYLNAKGYTLSQIKKVTDLKTDFLAAAASADVLIPVTHGLRIDNFLLGTKEGYKVTARKAVLNQITGKPTNIDFTAYFPPTPSATEIVDLTYLNLEDVSKLLKDRFKLKKNSLFVLNTSCFSEKTLDTWMYAWQLAEKSNGNQKIIPPIVVGSKKGFDTDNSYSILSHLEYPLNTLEELARGGKAKDVIEVLKAPPQKTSVILNAVEKINQYYLKFYGIKLFPINFEKGFEPIINTEIAKYFDGSAAEIIVLTNPNDATDIKRF